MSYEIVYDKRASKEISKLPKKQVVAIIKKIDALENDPRPVGCIKLHGLFEELWRIRVGNYGVLYAIDDEIRIVEVRRVGHRKHVYE